MDPQQLGGHHDMIRKYSETGFEQKLNRAATRFGIDPDTLRRDLTQIDPSGKFHTWLLQNLRYGFEYNSLDSKAWYRNLLERFVTKQRKHLVPEQFRDINQVRSWQHLEEILAEPVSPQLQKYTKLRGVSVVAESPSWIILKVTDPESASTLADSTTWCTLSVKRAESYIEDRAGLYVVFRIDPEGVSKYAQFTGDLSEFKTIANRSVTEVPDDLYALLEKLPLKGDVSELNESKRIERDEAREEAAAIATLEGLKPGDIVEDPFTYPRTAQVPIPEDVTFRDNLTIVLTPIKSLPAGLTVEFTLDLRSNHNLTQLPSRLVVGENLNLFGTPIQKLPPDLKVGGKIFGKNPVTGRDYSEEYVAQGGSL